MALELWWNYIIVRQLVSIQNASRLTHSQRCCGRNMKEGNECGHLIALQKLLHPSIPGWVSWFGSRVSTVLAKQVPVHANVYLSSACGRIRLKVERTHWVSPCSTAHLHPETASRVERGPKFQSLFPARRGRPWRWAWPGCPAGFPGERVACTRSRCTGRTQPTMGWRSRWTKEKEQTVWAASLCMRGGDKLLLKMALKAGMAWVSCRFSGRKSGLYAVTLYRSNSTNNGMTFSLDEREGTNSLSCFTLHEGRG